MQPFLLLLGLVAPSLALVAQSCGRAPLPSCTARALSPQMGRVYEKGDKVVFIDGNNLMAHRKVTRGRDELAAKISGIRGARTVLVYDGKRGEAPSLAGSNPQVVVTSGGDDGARYATPCS